MSVEFGVLGPVVATVDGSPARLGGTRQRAVLASLLLRGPQVVPVTRIIDDVWSTEPPDSAANLVQGYVSALRKVLGRATIETAEPGYRLVVDPSQVDLLRFQRAASEGSSALALDQTAEAVTHLAAALGEWRGPALADLPLDGLTGLAARLDALRITAQEDYGDTLTRLGRYSAAAEHLEQVVADNPLRERPLRLLVLALAHAGRQADALTTYRQGRQRLVDELGLEPSKELQEVEAAILRDDLPRRGPAEVRQDPARSLLVALISGLDDLPTMLQLTRPLLGVHAGTAPAELLVAATVGQADELGATASELAQVCAAQVAEGLPVRAAAFSSLSPGRDLARLANEQDVDLLLAAAPSGLLEDPRLAALLADAACDVAVVVGEGPLQDGPLLVPFTGAEHDWAAVEIAAWFAGATSATMRLAGTAEVAGRRDASRLLANASLAVQRALGVAAEPLLVQPSPGALVSAGREAGLVVVGLSDRWRQEGLGRARTELALDGGRPCLLVRRGSRGGLLGRDLNATRYTWTVSSPAP